MEDQPGRAEPVPSGTSDIEDSEQARRRRERQAQREREVAERRAARKRAVETGGEGSETDAGPAQESRTDGNRAEQAPVTTATAGEMGARLPEPTTSEPTPPEPTPPEPASSVPTAAGSQASIADSDRTNVLPLRDASKVAGSATTASPRTDTDVATTGNAPADGAAYRPARRISLRAVPEDSSAAKPTPPLKSPRAAAPSTAAPAVKPVPPTVAPANAPAPAPAARPRVPLAGPARLKRRHGVMIVSFLLAVVLPSMMVAWYMWWVALDQYASRVGFSVQREESGSAVEILGGITELSGSSSTDTDILYKYIQSRELIETVNAKLNLVNIYTRPEDPMYSMPPDPTIEDLEAHWSRMVDIFYDTASYLIEVRVLAFRPEDANAITNIILTESTRTLNEISAAGRADAMRYAMEELEVSKNRLRQARQALTAFRIRTQIVDPAADVQGRMGLLNNLLSQQAMALIELDMVAATASQSDPRYIQAQRRVEVIEARLREERARFGDQPAEEDERYADLVAEFEALSVDLEFAQQAYLTSLATYDAAIAEAQRKSRYLATYLPPTRAERAEFPSRLLVFSLATGALFAIWSIAVLVYYTLRDRV